jgi:hypothetical protein
MPASSATASFPGIWARAPTVNPVKAGEGNTSLDRYTFLAATDKSWAGSCKDLRITLRDSTTQRERFVFNK